MCDELNSMPECVGCIGNSDCSDGVECTIDRCSDSECENVPLPSGSLCRGGFCNGDVDEHSCAPCLDDVSTGPDTGCTTDLPRCDTSVSPAECKKCAAASDCDDANDCTDEACNAGLCEHATLLGGTPCTYGYCNGIHGAEECVPRPCQTNPDCDDRAACTTDVCTSGFCVYTPDDGQCLDSGDVCGPNVCTVGTGCQAVDASRPIELLSNGNLDLGREDWLEMSAVYSGVIYPYDYIPTLFPHTRVYVAWLGNGEGGNDDANSLSQTVAVPEEAVRLELSFYYQVWADELPADQNQMEVRVRSTGASPPEELLFTLHNQDEVRVWKGVRLSIDTATWAGSDMVLELSGSSADGYTAFFVDSISLVATVCE
jgi:hypothetical protein